MNKLHNALKDFSHALKQTSWKNPVKITKSIRKGKYATLSTDPKKQSATLEIGGAKYCVPKKKIPRILSAKPEEMLGKWLEPGRRKVLDFLIKTIEEKGLGRPRSDEILEDTDIQDLGIDSLALFEILNEAEDQYSIKIDDEPKELVHGTIKQVVDLICNKIRRENIIKTARMFHKNEQNSLFHTC